MDVLFNLMPQLHKNVILFMNVRTYVFDKEETSNDVHMSDMFLFQA